MHTPHNTGKVKIGNCYQPSVHMSMSVDMERLQSALLCKRDPRIGIKLVQTIARALRATVGFLRVWAVKVFDRPGK